MSRNPVAIACLVSLIAAFARGEPPRKLATVEGFTEYRLANGFRILLCPDGSRPRVTVNLTVFAGSRHEGYGESGMAHLIEHLLCRGTATRPDFPRILKERGALWNASTWLDSTNYYETLPADDNNVAFAIRLEADRFVNALMQEVDLRSEMPVVRNELETGEDRPEYLLEQRMLASAFLFHNYGKTEIGNLSDIERVPIGRIRAFYRARYRPDNALLIVIGRFDAAKALDEANAAFGPLPTPGIPIDRTYTEEPPQDGERSVTLRRVGDLGAVGLLYHIPPGSHPDFAAVQVMAEMLAASPSGRLHSALVDSGKATSVEGWASAWHDPGVLRIMAKVARGRPMDEVRRTMLDVVESFKEPDVGEVDLARQRLLKERDQTVDAYPSFLAVRLSNWAAAGDWRLFFLHRDRLEAVTPGAVRDVAARYLRPSNRTVGLFEPTEKPDRVAIPAAPDVAPMVDGYRGREAGPSVEPLDLDPGRLVTPLIGIDGINVSLLPRQTANRAVHILINLRYGTPEDFKGLVEAARLLPEMMTRGTKRRSKRAIRDALDLARSDLAASGSPGLVSLAIETRRPALAEVLELVRQVVREPSLPAEEFTVVQAEELARLDEWRSNPTRLAANRLDRMLANYPSDDVRYVPTIDERIARVKAVNLDQIKAIHERMLGSVEGEIVVVGDFDEAQLLPQLAQAFGGRHSGRRYSRIGHPYQANLKPDHQSISTPDRANAVYFAGLTIPMGEDHPDYPAVVVANLILGGPEYDNRGFKDEPIDPFRGPSRFMAEAGLSSRLVDRLRHRGGLSYGAASFFTAEGLDPSARLTIYANTSPGKIPEVEAAVADELRRWVDRGITADELDRARAEYLFAREVERSNNASLALLIARQVRAGRTMKSVAELEASVRRLTADEVSRAIRRNVEPAKLSTVTAGDFGPR